MNVGSTNAKRDIPMFAERYLQGRMNLDGPVSKRISLREVNDDYATLKDGSLTRSSFVRNGNSLSKETSDERYGEQRRDQDNRDALH